MENFIELEASRKFINGNMRTVYDGEEIEKFLCYLNESGYTITQTWEGVLGCGNWVCTPYDDAYSFVIREVYLNSNSSTHIIKRFSSLPKKYLAEIEAADNA